MLRVFPANPPGTDSFTFLDTIVGRSASEGGVVYWKQSAGNSGYNLDMTGVTIAQRCYELCQLVNEGVCWIFRYVCPQGLPSNSHSY